MEEAAISAEAARAWQALCSFCSWAFLEGNEQEGVRRLVDERDLLLEPPFTDVAPEAARELHDALEAAAREGETGMQELLREIHLDHTYLFSMTGQSRTTPYESVYRTDDATMFGPTTLQVREAYRAYGLMFERCANEPDDHVGLELAFVSHLLGQTANALEADGAAVPLADAASSAAPSLADGAAIPLADAASSAASPLADAAAFLSEHLLVFAPLYCKNVQVRAHTSYYRAIAGIAAGTLDSLSCSLKAAASETIDIVRYTVTE